MTKRLPFLLTLAAIGAMTMGFRTMGPGYAWEITTSDPWVWVDFQESSLDTTFGKTIFEDGSDPLADVDSDQRVATILALIAADYNSVKTSKVRLAMIPRDNYPALTTPDAPEYTSDLGSNRTITIKVAASTGAAAGYAQADSDGEAIRGCSIVLAAATFSSAESFKRTVTHEIGHCMGLNHNHVDHDAVMSYSAIRHSLGVDDKMGLTHLYPSDPDYGDEMPTFGLACQPL